MSPICPPKLNATGACCARNITYVHIDSQVYARRSSYFSDIIDYNVGSNKNKFTYFYSTIPRV